MPPNSNEGPAAGLVGCHAALDVFVDGESMCAASSASSSSSSGVRGRGRRAGGRESAKYLAHTRFLAGVFVHREHAIHHAGEALPVAGVGGKLASAGFGDGVELGLAVVAGGAPRGTDPAALFEANQGGVDGALIEQDLVAADLLNAPCDAVAVQRTHGGEGLQDHQVESSLQEIEFGRRFHRAGSCGVRT